MCALNVKKDEWSSVDVVVVVVPSMDLKLADFLLSNGPMKEGRSVVRIPPPLGEGGKG